MTKEASFKRRVRDRMAKTGERYTAARAHVAQQRDRKAPQDTPDDRPADDKVVAATGKRWDEWFAILDRWGARQKTHTQIAAHLVEEHGVPGWWAQAVTMWFERSRGMRRKHEKADGFGISATKTIDVPARTAFDAFVDDDARAEWLHDGTLTVRTATPARTARFDWDGGPSRVYVSFAEKGPAKTVVALQHERLPDEEAAEAAKLAWRERLTDLKTRLEAASG